MVAKSVVESVRSYLHIVKEHGVPVTFGVVFGSQVRGTATDDSDIDLIVVSPRFDGPKNRDNVSILWRLTVQADHRVEPIPVGEREWREDDSRAVVEIARREGEIVHV